MDSNTNALNWFEIAVQDMPRAKHFYQVIFGIHMHDMSMGNMLMAGFPGTPDNGKVSGALVKSDSHVPSLEGAVIYLNANPDMEGVLAKVEEMGGQILLPKTDIGGGIGFMAFIRDTEGNRVGLHANN